MVKSFVVCVLTCLEYTITFLFIVSLVFLLVQTLEILIPDMYDYSMKQELLEAVKMGCDTKQITSDEGAEILQICREYNLEIQRRRKHTFYAVSICMSVVIGIFLFQRYRSLRFRERLRNYLFPANKS